MAIHLATKMTRPEWRADGSHWVVDTSTPIPHAMAVCHCGPANALTGPAYVCVPECDHR